MLRVNPPRDQPGSRRRNRSQPPQTAAPMAAITSSAASHPGNPPPLPPPSPEDTGVSERGSAVVGWVAVGGGASDFGAAFFPWPCGLAGAAGRAPPAPVPAADPDT